MASQFNPNYRVEHVAPVPRGWKVRTKMQSTHMVRIAFPPGARRKGSGKVVEIFHPVNENPCAMRNPPSLETRERQRATRDRAGRIRAARISNPGSMDHAAELYEKFHGQSPERIVEIQESDTARKTYTALGALTEMVIDARAGKVKISFVNADGVMVASAPGGHQIYFIGGNQNIESQLEKFGSDEAKDFVELGATVKLTYRARKSMDNFDLVDYYHHLGEETNEPPFAFYDRLKRRIFLVGGRYRVEAPGIIN
jgi:hypothetical protein